MEAAAPTRPVLDRTLAEEWAGWFRALGDPTRILLLHVMASERRPLTVGEITERLDVGQSTVSHHLAKLLEVGFVLVERSGTSSLFRVNDNCIDCFPTAAEVVLGTLPVDFDPGRPTN